MHDRANSMPLATILSISPFEIVGGDDSRADVVDDNKPIEVDTPRLKRNMVDLPTLKKKLQTSPSSLSSDLTELSQLKREQMIDNKQYQIKQFRIEERKLKLLEQESTIKWKSSEQKQLTSA